MIVTPEWNTFLGKMHPLKSQLTWWVASMYKLTFNPPSRKGTLWNFQMKAWLDSFSIVGLNGANMNFKKGIVQGP